MSGGQAEVRWWKSFHNMLKSRDFFFFFLEGNGRNNLNLCFGCFVARSPQTHWCPLSSAHILDYQRLKLHSGSFWFVLIHNWMHSEWWLSVMLPKSSCGHRLRKCSTQSWAFPGPLEPPSSGSASWCVSMCGFLCFAKSTVLGRGKEALPLYFSRKPFTASPHLIHLRLPKLCSLPPSATPCFECFKLATLTLDL